MKHIVFYSGGICSRATAKRVAERYGTKDLILFFTDTMIEDEDLYRFLDETSKEIGGEYFIKEYRKKHKIGYWPQHLFEDNAYRDTYAAFLESLPEGKLYESE